MKIQDAIKAIDEGMNIIPLCDLIRKFTLFPEDDFITFDFKVPGATKITTIRGPMNGISSVLGSMILRAVVENISLEKDGIHILVNDFQHKEPARNTDGICFRASALEKLIRAQGDDDVRFVDEDMTIYHDTDMLPSDKEYIVREIHYTTDLQHDGTVDNHLMQDFRSPMLFVYVEGHEKR